MSVREPRSQAPVGSAAPDIMQPATIGMTALYGMVTLYFFASLIGYLDRVNISVAAVTMEPQFHWSPTTKNLVLSASGIGYTFAAAIVGAGGALVWLFWGSARQIYSPDEVSAAPS